MIRFCAIVAAGLTASLAIAGGPAAAQALKQGQAAPEKSGNAARFQHPQVDATMAMFAYSRLTGQIPEFVRYAERSQAFQRATAFDRDQIREREAARMEAQFRSFDPTKLFLARLTTTLNQYDMGRQGYAIPLTETSYVSFYDSVVGKQYGVQFRNPDEANFIRLPDVSVARGFAERNKLNMQGSIAANVVIEIVFRMVDAAPETAGGPLLIRSDIVAARVLKDNKPLHEFKVTPAAAPARPGPVAGGRLKSAEVQGVRLGMPQTEAEALAARIYAGSPTKQADGATAYFEALAEGAAPLCGVERDSGAARGADGRPTFFTVPDSSAACLAFETGSGGVVSRVVSGQRLETATREQLRAALEEKYGPPSAELEGGTFLTWIGADPADAAPVWINARIQQIGSGALTSLLLGVELLGSQASPPRPGRAASGGPRL